MARTNGPIKVWSRNDTVPTDAEGGFAGGDSTAAAVRTSLDQSGKALGTVDNLAVTASTLDYGQEATATISGTSLWKTIHVGIPKGMSDDVGQQLVTDAQTAAQQSTASAADAAQSLTLAQQAQAAKLEVPDANMAAAIGNPATDTHRALVEPTSPVVGKGQIVLTPLDHGAIPLADAGGAGADSTAALQAVLDQAKSLRTFVGADVSRRIHLAAYYKATADLVIDDDDMVITGEGGGSGILFLNAGLVIDGSAGLVQRVELRNLRIRRVTTSGQPHGVAVDVLGGSTNSGNYPCRFTLADSHFESPINGAGVDPGQSVALRMRGTFLSTCTNLYLRNANTGLVIDVDPVANNLGANAITFVGGEIQAVDHIGRVGKAIGLAFFGMAWEGATLSGMDVNNAHGLTISGAYWENNGSYDLRVGNEVACYGVSVTGGTASIGARLKDRSIVLHRSLGTDISGMYFANYSKSPVVVDELTANQVTGGANNCHNSFGSRPVVEVISGGLKWNVARPSALTVTGTAAGSFAEVDGRPGTQRTLRLTTEGVYRWALGTDAVSETGGNAGANWQLIAYSDAGTYLGGILTAYRADQTLRIHGPLRHTGPTAGFFGAPPTAQPTLPDVATVTAADIRGALITLGLCQPE